ncbi:glycosyltransferase family 1 protein [Fistulina hepatica ATCC 64428]|uniref:sterol 3beta-glucosyltransferase n=1 Tax=Fistulina hepatica ATCC 64428 TaxID=1128425 RepID=A0A0D7AKM2_9AGAR|nr:glycosyltransferase family 1 protein [Fistulina hepatica ATCC 64428]
MATVKLQRRARLAGKLKDIFELDSINEVLAEMPCWLLRSVLLQGYMYLTNSYICFFAHMPLREDQVLKSGSLHKKAQRTKRWIKHWFVLKNDALSWYQSSADPYFPHGIVDLRYAISCDPVDDKDFRIRTNQKTILLSAYSAPSREEWVKSIRKVMFKAQNSGDSVKIAIPYSCILDVERSTAMDFSETIEVKVFEKESPFSIDSYFFAYFHDLPAALDQIRDAVRDYRNRPHLDSPQALLDTTVPKGPPMTVDRTASLPAEIPSSVSSPLTPSVSSSSRTGFRLTSLFRMPTLDARSGVPLSRGSSGESSQSASEDFTYISRRPDSFIPITTSPDMEQASETPTQSRIEHTYPPSTSLSPAESPDESSFTRTASATPTQIPAASSFSSLLPISVPLWLRPSRKLWGASGGQLSVLTSSNVKEVYSPHTIEDRRTNGADMAFSVLETPDVRIDTETTDKFRQAFAYDEKEILLGYFPGYLFRLLPIYGRMYVSTNYFCYKSSSRLTSRTRVGFMAIPIRDILSLQKSKGTRFGHHGVIVIIKGHEELFFEYWAEDKRDAFVRLLQRQMEDVSRRLEAGNDSVPTQGQRDALILEEFDAPPHSTDANEDGESGSAPDVGLADSLPAVMFTSASSTFLTFKPKKSMHFTCLTIGSRGDVQPYIALAKGLMADGHRVRIATHVEFKDWIESHGIEYGYVGGDPAELMRICVENGVFTVSFLKEGLQKFRGWLDDLLKTSWEACQGTDVLIESPSAMGGYHIAEALRIPYYRAFTMTWSRTRAYPHAFAVPENRMGGSYNYMSYVLFDQVFWRAISGQINRWRRKLLNLDSTSLDKMEPHKIPFLYNFSPHVVPPPLDWPEWIRVTGYWFLNDADASGKKWTPPPDLVQFIDSAHKQGKKIVYIGFGSIVVSHPKAMTRCIIEAVVASGVHAVLSKGWSDRLTAKTGEASQIEEPLPKQIYPIPSIPHDWLFPRIDAACHHGGAGTTGASLRSGLPTIVHPFFGDQFFWADRVEALGVGSCIRKLTTEGLTRAFSSVTSDVKQIERAKLLGEKLRAEDGVAAAVECIYRDLEYAKSLIKRLDTDDESDHDKATHSSPEGNSGYSSSGSARLGGASSEDWSVISDQDEPRVSSSSRHSGRRRHSDGRDRQAKRHSFAAAVLSALPDALAHSSNKTAPNSPRHNSSVLPS